MPSHEWDHLQLRPALHPASDLKYLHGVVDIEVELPLPLSDFGPVGTPGLLVDSSCLTLMVVVDGVGVDDMRANVSTSANTH